MSNRWRIGIGDQGSGIRKPFDLDCEIFRIPDPGSLIADPGSRIPTPSEGSLNAI